MSRVIHDTVEVQDAAWAERCIWGARPLVGGDKEIEGQPVWSYCDRWVAGNRQEVPEHLRYRARGIEGRLIPADDLERYPSEQYLAQQLDLIRYPLHWEERLSSNVLGDPRNVPPHRVTRIPLPDIIDWRKPGGRRVRKAQGLETTAWIELVCTPPCAAGDSTPAPILLSFGAAPKTLSHGNWAME
ncbi:MAG: hypothetical protein HN348_13235 [Proteobacteria bacterium]|nr:hypothetical protein [Pseudomonadota bacterium]